MQTMLAKDETVDYFQNGSLIERDQTKKSRGEFPWTPSQIVERFHRALMAVMGSPAQPILENFLPYRRWSRSR